MRPDVPGQLPQRVHRHRDAAAGFAQETKKFQNVRGDSLDAKLARIQDAGLDINAGFIVGFDSDDKAIFEDQFQFIQDNGITLAMVGMLQAIPKTPLYDRLEKEGRLIEDDPELQLRPQANDARRTAAGLLEPGQAAVHARSRSSTATSRCISHRST